MPKTGKKLFMGRSRGYLHAAGPQFRFILFLILLLICYTILLRVFQKLAEIVQLPIFLPISLVTLLIFIGIGGILYSHSFVGPIIRIRKALEHLSEGETNICLRLRESDDPMLQDLVKTISQVCEHNRNFHSVVQEAARDLSAEIAALKQSIQHDARMAEIKEHVERLQEKKDILDKTIKSFGKK